MILPVRLEGSAFTLPLPSPLDAGLPEVAQAWKGKVCGKGLRCELVGESGGNRGKEENLLER